MRQYIRDFIGLFYPAICVACGEGLAAKEEYICLSCLQAFPKTDFHNQIDNPLADNFNGRVPLIAAAAWCHYQKGNSIQKVIHEMKYKGKKEIGIFVGRWYGSELKNAFPFKDADLIIPVPLHKRKKIKRGYNQSEYFARGLSQSMKIPLNTTVLLRIKNTETQTNKTRYARWENVLDVFKVNDSISLKGKNVLLVDDIVTTGATIEACATTLLEANAKSVCIAAIGYASD